MLVKFSLFLSWIFGFIALLLLPILWPTLKLGYFVCFTVLLIYKRPFYKTLFSSFFSGLIVDCFTNSPLFGTEAFLYTVTSASLFHLKKHLYDEKILTLPLMAYFFSSLMTLYHLLFYLFLGSPVPIRAEQLFKELTISPCIEFICAFLLLIIPLRLIPKLWHYIKQYRLERA